MKILFGNTGSPEQHAIMREYGWGIMLSSQWRNFDLPYYAIDNGAFKAFKNKQPYDPALYLHMLEKAAEAGKDPLFAVVPDIVAGGKASLAFSRKWLEQLRQGAWQDFAYYLAVQDGMTFKSVLQDLWMYDGIFVGGTLEWKHRMAPAYVEIAHDLDKPCHIGRVGSMQRILWARRIGADSIDGTTWPRHDSWRRHIIGADKQTIL